MSVLEARLRLERLHDVYAPLLTERQSEVFVLHYHEDLSLGEIAERLCISRPAVADNLRRSEEHLEWCESRLGFRKREDLVEGAVDEALVLLEGFCGGSRCEPECGAAIQKVATVLRALRDQTPGDAGLG